MIPQFSNQAYMSFFLYSENRVINTCQAYINHTSKLYYQPDASLPTGVVAYASPFKQWVCDSGVAGAWIANTISGSLGVLNRGTSGLSFDYDNGRVLLNASVGTKANLTGSYAIKEINFYQSNETQETLISSSDLFFLNPRFHSTPTGYVPPYTMAAPAIVITPLNQKNEPWALGGQKMSNYYMSAMVLTENPRQMDALLGCFSDAAHHHIPILNVSDDPINEFGDTKSGYDYGLIKASKGTPGNLMYIKDVKTSRVSDSVRNKIGQKLFMGIVDTDIQFPRNTPA